MTAHGSRSSLARNWHLGIAALAVALATSAVAQTPPMSIVTGSERSTSIQIGRDLQALVARPAGLELRPLASEGSAANVHRLRNEAGVRLGLVQSDVYQAYLDEAKADNADAQRLSAPLRVVMPLYDEEMYFVVRADSPLNYVHEIEGRRINVGPIGGGTALSANTLYRQLFGADIAAGKISHLANEEALLKLATGNTMDVAIIFTGQPARLFAEMKQEARQYIKLLRLTPDALQAASVLKSFHATSIRASSYPSWLAEDVPTLGTRVMLVTYDFNLTISAQQQLVRFAQSLCANFQRLRDEGHPKWQEVLTELPALGEGWRYHAPTQSVLSNCRDAEIPSVAQGPVTKACAQDRKALGLCARSGGGKF
jgi:uncharacterized protein